jgi:hypothetical protein
MRRVFGQKIKVRLVMFFRHRMYSWQNRKLQVRWIFKGKVGLVAPSLE